MEADQPSAAKKVRSTFSMLHYILYKDKTKILEKLLQRNVDLKTTDNNGSTLLHSIFNNKRLGPDEMITILGVLLDQSVDPTIQNKDGITALHLAVEKRMNQAVDLLINRGAKIDIRDKKGNSIAHFFVNSEHMNYQKSLENDAVNFVQWLIARGFDFDRRNRSGQSALHLAIKFNLQHILPTLLKHSTDMNFVRKRDNKNLLHLFLEVCLRQTDAREFIEQNAVEIVKILLDREISVDHVDADGKTAVDLAFNSKTQLDILKMILERTTNVHKKNVFGQTLLHQMVSRETRKLLSYNYCFQMARSLIEKGSDVNSEDIFGSRPIHLIVRQRDERMLDLLLRSHDERMLDLLLSAGCNVDATDSDGEPPLHTAIINHDVHIIRKLLAHGANVNKKDRKGMTPIHLVVNIHDETLIGIIVSAGCNLNATDSDGRTPLHLAIEKSNTSVAQKLIEHGADVNRRDTHNKITPLLLAAKREVVNVIKLLIDKGADVNCKDPRTGERPLHLIAEWNNDDRRSSDNLKMLLERGAHVNARDNSKQTALFRAIKSGNGPGVEELIKYGADIYDSRILGMDESISGCETFFKLRIKLKTANLLNSKEYLKMINVERDIEFYENCLREIEVLKNTSIASHTSLYQWLHMDPNRRCMHIHNEKLKNLINSSKLKELFPEYLVVILACHYQTIARKPLLEPAKVAWLKLTEISLPDICVECILSYLSYSDLLDIIGKN